MTPAQAAAAETARVTVYRALTELQTARAAVAGQCQLGVMDAWHEADLALDQAIDDVMVASLRIGRLR